MRDMFSSLHALLPQLPPKKDKSTIVDEAISSIKNLQQRIQMMQKLKQEKLAAGLRIISYEPGVAAQNMPTYNTSREAYLAEQVSSMNVGNALPVMPTFPVGFETWASPNVVLNVSGEDAHISICVPKKLGNFNAIVFVLEKHGINVVTTQLNSDFYRSIFMIHAHANTVFYHDQRVVPAEEIFKSAVGEIMMWLSA